MALDSDLLRSRFAKRILLLLIACTLLPIIGYAVTSYLVVAWQLDEQALGRLRQECRIVGSFLHDRFGDLEADIGECARRIADCADESTAAFRASISWPGSLDESGEYLGLAVFGKGENPVVFQGELLAGHDSPAPDGKVLCEGRIVVGPARNPEHASRLVVTRAIDPEDLAAGVVVAEIDGSFFWSLHGEPLLPPTIEVTVLDASGRLVLSSMEPPRFLRKRIGAAIDDAPMGKFHWSSGDTRYLAAYWTLPVTGRPGSPHWTVVLSEPAEHVLASMEPLGYVFVGVGTVALLLALLIGMSTIRRRLEPMRRIQEGSEMIARWDFDSRIEVSCGDEFEDVAESFNDMASRLSKQFHTLITMAEVHRAILESPKTATVVDTVLRRMRDILPYDCISVTLLNDSTPGEADSFVGSFESGFMKEEIHIDIAADEIERLYTVAEYVSLGPDDPLPLYVAPLVQKNCTHFLVLPVFLMGKLTGMITLAHTLAPRHDNEGIALVRQLADQVTLALSKSQLIDQLDQLNVGTLRAFARAIDAKSPWTAGHSERVTKMAVRIGKEMGLSAKCLGILYRGGLVHDIGKIGIPPEILDKPGRLSDDEFETMRQHTLLGARILEPIQAYEDVIPIVLGHHERYDGKGYPHGLAGEEIDKHARIFAVADCFDAMISDRPYRIGMELDIVLKIIGEGSGTQFDSRVVEAFLPMMERDREEESRALARDEPVLEVEAAV